ncbi:MAG: amidohydrolase [Clostridia bacterium]|nr:amidohydrolase [Clostridia bacterium]
MNRRDVTDVGKDFDRYLRDLLADFHREPELSHQEYNTTRRIRQELEDMGVEILPSGLKTGLVARITGGRPGPVIGLRCDIDALPIAEDTALPYASQTPGVMHSCGHDFHTVTMLGAARLLKEHQAELPGTVKIVFQPAEETADGAVEVLKEQLTDDCRLFLAVHSYPHFPAGTLGLKTGPVMAAVDRFKVTITGRGAHGAEPHKGIDPIPVAAALVQSLQTLVSRVLDPFSPAVCSVTHLESGNTWNVIPETALLEGTIRTLNPADRVTMREGFCRMTEAIASAWGAKADIEWFAGPPAVINDERLTALCIREASAMGFAVDRQEDTMGGEDFSQFIQSVPGVFVRVGTGGDCPSHHPHFTVDPAALTGAAQYFARMASVCLESLADD